MSRSAVQSPIQCLNHSGCDPRGDSPIGSLTESKSANPDDMSDALALGLRCILMKNKMLDDLSICSWGVLMSGPWRDATFSVFGMSWNSEASDRRNRSCHVNGCNQVRRPPSSGAWRGRSSNCVSERRGWCVTCIILRTRELYESDMADSGPDRSGS